MFSDLLMERKYGVLGQNREAIFGKKKKGGGNTHHFQRFKGYSVEKE